MIALYFVHVFELCIYILFVGFEIRFCTVWPTVGPSVRHAKDKRPQAARYKWTFPWDVDVTISKGALRELVTK